MIEMFKVFGMIEQGIISILYSRLKDLRYNEALLILDKYERSRQYYTNQLQEKDLRYIESQMSNLDHLKNETDWIKFLKEILRHNGAPQDLI